MMEMKTIPDIMLRDHARIHNLIGEIERNIKDNLEDAEHLFIRLKWTVQKHFFVEEKVIFSVYESSNEEREDLDRLVKEHKEVLLLIKRIDDNFKKSNSHGFFQETKKLLSKHAKFEEEVFYPRLEEELSDKEKQLIYDRCEEWV